MTGYSVFRRTRNGKKAKRWTILLTLPDGSRRERAGFTDKAASQQLGAQLVRELERKEVGLHDVYAKWRRMPITKHVDAFLTALESGNLGRRRRGGRPSDDYQKRTKKRLLLLLQQLGAARLEHLNQAQADHVLAEGVRGGWSDKTRDDHGALLRQFGAWLVDEGRWPVNPFHRLRQVRTQASRTFRRRALTVADVGLLVEAAEVRPVANLRKAMPQARPARLAKIAEEGRERGLLYLFAAYTGLRRGEITSLQWCDMHLGGDEPHVVLRAEITKNRKAARIDIPTWLAERVKELQVGRARRIGGTPAPTARVFLQSYRHVMDRMAADVAYAKLGTETVFMVGGKPRKRLVDATGRVIDFHALRGTFATLLAELGVPERVAKELMRHSDTRMTFEVYAQARAGLGRSAVDQLPQPEKRSG